MVYYRACVHYSLKLQLNSLSTACVMQEKTLVLGNVQYVSINLDMIITNRYSDNK